MSIPINRRQFTATVAATVVGTAVAPRLIAVEPRADDEERATGPMVGHVSTTSAVLWFRPAEEGAYELIAKSADEGASVRAVANAMPENDFCVRWRLEGLAPATRYTYRIRRGESFVLGRDEHFFNTAPAESQPTRVCLAFGSCADSKPLPLWTQIAAAGVQGVVLLGDTPYIDSTDLDVARRKHRNFLAVPELATLACSTPIWGTWDDHDFGRNDSDGTLPGKENSRRAFVEYRANANFGDNTNGIYTKFRYGPVEIFLLDTRWFARTEPSPVDSTRPTLLGREQWNWLLASLRESTATFKVIACGMIWDDKQNKESDDWESYAHERAALFAFLGQESIDGVVLVGGDIHCSRHLRYPTAQQFGYDFHQFIVSPIHDRIIPALNVDHPNLVNGAAIPHVWLQMVADTTTSPATLHAKWEQMQGQPMWEVRLTENDLRRPVA